jgi:uncharacterized phiE125 gp8 family phage protein
MKQMLVHRTPQNVGVSPVGLLSVKAHCRVDYSEDDQLIEGLTLAAMADIEDLAQIAVLTQTVRVTIFSPGYETTLHLPIGPALQSEGVTVTLDGEPFTGFELITGNRPMIRFHASYPDPSPSRLQIEYQAGFGSSPQHVPRDLQLAITDQAALMYDARGQMDAKALSTSPQLARVAARYRGLRA